MIEKEMQELLWRYPERLLNEPLKQFASETSSDIGRADLVFEDRHGRLLIIEVKRGKLPRGAIDQLLDYFGMMKLRFPERAVELMVVANVIPSERQITCESRDIECRPIAEKTFREVAEEVGYRFASESTAPHISSDASASSPSVRDNSVREHLGAWSFSNSGRPSADAQDFLLRCDEQGQAFFAALFEAQKTIFNNNTRITWNHQSGFSMQFYFHRVGFAPVLWGFPFKNREGKSIRQRIDFPFDFSVKAGVPETFVDEMGASLSSIIPFSGGRKRPSIQIAAMGDATTPELIQTIFSFAVKSSKK